MNFIVIFCFDYSNRHVLWISERSNAPDLGGAERDEHMIWSEALVCLLFLFFFFFFFFFF